MVAETDPPRIILTAGRASDNGLEQSEAPEVPGKRETLTATATAGFTPTEK